MPLSFPGRAWAGDQGRPRARSPGRGRYALKRCADAATGLAEFYREAKDECLPTILVSAGDRDAAQDLVAEAFARAWAPWRTVSGHPARAAWVVRTALNASISRWQRRRREVPVADLALVAGRPFAAGLEARVGGNQRAHRTPPSTLGFLLSKSISPTHAGRSTIRAWAVPGWSRPASMPAAASAPR